jgi:hypothetical protein
VGQHQQITVAKLMWMTRDELQKRLDVLEPGGSGIFSVSATNDRIPNVAALFRTYLRSDTLTIKSAKRGSNQLTVSGDLTLGTNKPVSVDAKFTLDVASANVTGIIITCELPQWTWTSPGIAFAARSVSNYLRNPKLTLMAGDSGPTAMLSGSIANGSILSATLPVADSDVPLPIGFNWEAPPGSSGIKLTDIKDLKQFVPRADFPIVPSEIPVTSALTLSRIELTLGTGDDVVSGLNFGIKWPMQQPWGIGSFTIDEFDFYFSVPFPAQPGPIPVYGSLATKVKHNSVFEIDVSAAITDGGLFVEGTSSTPELVKPFLSNYFSCETVKSIPDKFQISKVEFGIGLQAKCAGHSAQAGRRHGH